MPVAILPPHVVAQIAAGEVVERPASVVKELVENALDAGARRIKIGFRDGGRTFIRVSDDGAGMSPDDLHHAIQPHATSKVRQADDLNHLTTLGFRGEALPSIAAVSRLTILTRPPTATAGHRLTIEASRIVGDAPQAAAPGTIVTVEDLFANVPARLKFLRTIATESAVITRTVVAYALAYPEIQFEVRQHESLVFATDGRGDRRAVLAAVHDPATARAMLPIEATLPADERAGAVAVAGLISLPPLARSHRQDLYLFVNRRWIQSRSLTFAVEEVYQSLLMVGRHPLGAVLIEVPAGEVDVNVHPTKAEVRLVNERRVFRLVRDAVVAALQGTTAAVPTFGEAQSSLSEAAQRRLALSSLLAARPQATTELSPQPAADEAAALSLEQLSGLWQPAPSPERDAGPPAAALPILRVVGQIGQTYIVAEGPTGLYLVDQHAAHERILYEELRGQMLKAAVDSQLLLNPVMIEPSPAAIEVIETEGGALASLGFRLEPFGSGVYAIRAIPGILRRRDVAAAVLGLVEEMASGGEGEWLERLAITTACHSAIRAGQTLSPEEMRQLILQLERCTQPRHCAHGRPTMLHLSQLELEREFGRRAP